MKKIKPNLTLADIQWFKSEFIPDLAEAVQKKLEKNIDKMTSSLDKLVGEVKGYREEAEKTLNIQPHSS